MSEPRVYVRSADDPAGEPRVERLGELVRQYLGSPLSSANAPNRGSELVQVTRWLHAERLRVSERARDALVAEAKARLAPPSRLVQAVKLKSREPYEFVLNHQHLQVLQHLARGPASDYQVVRADPRASHQLGARRCELRDAGLVERDGTHESGMTWRLTQAGRLMLATHGPDPGGLGPGAYAADTWHPAGGPPPPPMEAPA